MSFVAKYDSGTCPKCHAPIQAGEDIQTYSVGQINRYEHVLCPKTADVTCSICGGRWIKCDCP